MLRFNVSRASAEGNPNVSLPLEAAKLMRKGHVQITWGKAMILTGTIVSLGAFSLDTIHVHAVFPTLPLAVFPTSLMSGMYFIRDGKDAKGKGMMLATAAAGVEVLLGAASASINPHNQCGPFRSDNRKQGI